MLIYLSKAAINFLLNFNGRREWKKTSNFLCGLLEEKEAGLFPVRQKLGPRLSKGLHFCTTSVPSKGLIFQSYITGGAHLSNCFFTTLCFYLCKSFISSKSFFPFSYASYTYFSRFFYWQVRDNISRYALLLDFLTVFHSSGSYISKRFDFLHSIHTAFIVKARSIHDS